jgi:hypothetical protein
MIEQFPYYSKDVEYEEINLVSEQLLEIIRSIDAEAAKPDRYWLTFVDDVQMDDFNTEAVMAIYS